MAPARSRLTSGGCSVGFGKRIGMGSVRLDLAVPGIRLQVFGRLFEAVVAEDGPCNPQNAHMRING